jgi:hypothetical protein
MKYTDFNSLVSILLAACVAIAASPALTAEPDTARHGSVLLQPAVGEASDQCRQPVGPFRSEAAADAAQRDALRAGYRAGAVVTGQAPAAGALPRYFFTVAYPC